MIDIREIFRNTAEYAGKEVVVGGWVRTVRASKAFGFIELNDGTFFSNLQIVFEDGIVNDFKAATKLTVGSAIICTGTLELTPGAKQPFELKAKEIVLEGDCPSDYPLQKKRHSFEYLRTQAHLRPRTNTFSAVFRVRSAVAWAIHKFFNERKFVYVHTPLITASDAEGAGQMFHVTTLDLEDLPKTEQGEVDYNKDFFGKSANLTVSGQLEAECYALAFKNVYTFGPTFRAENSNTPRHASEFWMIEPEMAFADLKDDMALAEDLIKYIINTVRAELPEEMAFFNNFVDKGISERLDNIVNSDFGHITYTEAIEILEKSGRKFDYPVFWGMDMQSEHERYITEEVFNKPVFVTDYPKEIKAFYMRLNDDNKTVAAMDLLVPGVGEIIGGSQREERLEILEARVKELGMDMSNYWWYMDLRKFGGVKHAGFGLGFERIILYLTGMGNIRDVLPFPRTPRSADF
ncbi:MAG: asparagine--tRNA ligase [Clostridiales bacterium]|nr:asparagine--tRNA ligase [Clostridiales bacterium]MBR3843553.1 asparagine--tRNA ligase [Christensenellaceae bacterium]